MINRRYIRNLFKPNKYLVIRDLITNNRSFDEIEIIFSRMTAEEFNNLGTILLEYVDEIANRKFLSDNLSQLTALHFVFAKYAIEAAHFQKGLKINKRISLEGMARAYQDAGEALEILNNDTIRLSLYQKAWSAHLESCYKYGYKSAAYSDLCKIREYCFFGVTDSQGPRR